MNDAEYFKGLLFIIVFSFSIGLLFAWMFGVAEFLKIENVTDPVTFRQFVKRSICLGPAYPISIVFLILSGLVMAMFILYIIPFGGWARRKLTIWVNE